MPRYRFIPLAATLVVAALTAAGCASSTAAGSSSSSSNGTSSAADAAVSGVSASSVASASGSSSGSGSAAVTITITDAKGCVSEPDTVPAGPVTFTIKNVDSTGVTEVHLVSGDRIRGERENLVPGFTANFSATLDGGAYSIYCPGANPTTTGFTVTGGAAANPTSVGVTALLTQGTNDYATYVDGQVAYLVAALPALQTAIAKGDLAAAQKAYAAARPFYEKIEPVAESFGDLDPNIDARDGDVPAAQWRGFHRIEQALFVTTSTKAAQPYVAPLLADVADLQKRAAQLTADTKADNGKGYQPDEVANGAVDLLGEVQKSKITGEEERYSHIDIVDFAANVEGSQQAFAVLAPALDAIDPTVVAPISARFKALNDLLDQLRDPTALGGVKLYPQVSKAQIKQLSDALLAVQEPLSKISAKIASA